ncbi:MAG: alpha/beta hydrolase [Acidimicrobiia bacterium]
MTNPPASEVLATWQALGTYFDVDGDAVFVLDVPPLYDEGKDPMFVLHGYPSCCYDWHHVLPDFGQNRRVVLFDYPGFGLSDKPNRRYSIEFYADAAERVAEFAGLESVVLVTHDLGDSVGGELLARDLDSRLAFGVSQRVITNGSIYMDLVQLSTGQQLLLGLEDAPVDLAAMGLDPKDGFKNGLGNTFSPAHPATDGELDQQWEFVSYLDGHKLLARTIRYIEDRRARESRYTGAIEKHPSPLGIVWGALDPIAVRAMSTRLVDARPDARLIVLDDVAHYPMIEAPDDFAAAVRVLLASA